LLDSEVVHHKNENKTDNRPENLEVLTASSHMREHADRRGRDELGRFPPADLRVREWPIACAARAGVAWTFGLKPDEYRPEVQT